jgi:hypothetical protein
MYIEVDSVYLKRKILGLVVLSKIVLSKIVLSKIVLSKIHSNPTWRCQVVKEQTEGSTQTY